MRVMAWRKLLQTKERSCNIDYSKITNNWITQWFKKNKKRTLLVATIERKLAAIN